MKAGLASVLSVAAVVAAGGVLLGLGQRLPASPTKPAVQLVGHDSKISDARLELVRDEAAWQALWAQHSGHEQSWNALERHRVPAVDFDRYVLVAAFNGSSQNTDGMVGVSVAPEGDDVRVRFEPSSFQTSGPGGGGIKTTAYGFWVIERPKGQVILEKRAPGLKADPVRWEEVKRFGA